MDLSTPEVAERLGVTRVTVWRWCKQDLFPNAYQINPHAERSDYRIPEEDVIAFEEARKGRQTNGSQSNDN